VSKLGAKVEIRALDGKVPVDSSGLQHTYVYSVEVPKFFAPVTNLLLPVERRTTWKGMRTVAQIKRETNIKVRARYRYLVGVIELIFRYPCRGSS